MIELVRSGKRSEQLVIPMSHNRDLHPTDEDLSLGTPDLHPTDEDLSVGTPDLGHPTIRLPMRRVETSTILDAESRR